MNYFTPDFLEFFKDLAPNNHKEWFDENRTRYENSVKKPFTKFIQDLISEIRLIDNTIQIQPNDAIFRINRDIRFSPDKSPYKMERSAIISPKGRKDHSFPGFYLSFGPEKVFFGGGAYFLNTDNLQKVRSHIQANNSRFEKIIRAESFKKFYPEILGEEHKRLPKEFKETAEKQPLLFKKQFYYMHELEPEVLLEDTILSRAMDHYHAALPLQQFLAEALA